MVTISSLYFRSVLAASALFLLTAGNPASADPSDRVARMSYIRGDVSFQPGGSGEWVGAVINRPVVSGDRIATDRDARVELEIGAGSIRVDQRSTVSLLDINDRITQVELTDGTLNIDVRRLIQGQIYEVDTPTLAFVVSQPGEYRVDVAPNGGSTMVTVFRGSGDVYGENNASYRVRDGQSYRFNDTALRDYETLDLPRADDFDRFCQQRNDRYERAVSSRYVSDEIVGYADLDDYGSWSTVSNYGSVWYPRGLRSDWAPYRDGHWVWIDPWGWSWIDDQPWGFAPSHYGRWAQINSRWGWVPGPRQLRPVYAPALVAFVGGSNWGISIGNNPVGWFPLGPRDVYRPWYDCSRDYFTRVNTRNTIINNITVVNVYNDYSRGRPSRGDYAYRRDQGAFTAVPGNVFAGAQPVGRSRLRLNQDAIGRADVINAVAITPVQASLAQRGSGRVHRPDPERFDRAVVARNEPPAKVLPFAQREAIIRDNGNRSPGMAKLRGPDRSTVAPEDRRIRVVDAENKAKPRELPVAANRVGSDRANINRAEPRTEDRVNAAERVDRPANADAGKQLDRRADGERVRANADPRQDAGNVDQRLPSTRYSPASRNRPIDDTSRKDIVEQRQQAAEQSDTRKLQRSQDAQRVRADADQQRAERQQATEQRARRIGPDATDPPERLQPQAQRQQRDVAAERQADQQRGNDLLQQRRAQAQKQREQPAEGIQLPPQQRDRQSERLQVQEQQRVDQADRNQAQQMQRNQQAERMQAQEQQRADQADRNQAQQMQRNQQAERIQAQQQQRVEQDNRNQSQQMQRQQEQADRQSRAQEQQVQMQQRQQEDQSRQMQQQEQMQQRQQQAQQVQMQRQEQQQQVQQVQAQRQQQQQQPQPQPQQDQRAQRQKQRQDARDAKEEQQNR